MMNENYEERIRFERVLSQPRRAPVKSMTGFVVESSAPVVTRAEGVAIYDKGMFVGVAPISDEMGDE